MIEHPVSLQVLTWGYNRTPMPKGVNLAVDVRWIPNPWHRPEFHDLSGLDKPMQDWVFAQPGVVVWFEALLDLVGPMVVAAEENGVPVVTVAIGCQGGHDRVCRWRCGWPRRSSVLEPARSSSTCRS